MGGEEEAIEGAMHSQRESVDRLAIIKSRIRLGST